ncbi:hypothetical protein ABB37_00662 [Leptomonas pyrrhocoris]|uniref:Uncharacterized protein n=1 Tax=Leptomonas pyrrhocoris TaxID=157538 RepID=A0A0M9GB71_LEPPY|nr:hypothetical protein ABB37_00662 [Leptomonas pyrrhocoris]KPA86516.1 hypothetical protein ABB37_00662 [Leptomonas pyrrhocoris]|eukprot:XP_015664955.1 hypothetical protein ABB37_00662 [Leptomonas pyrrhocoris]
MPRSFARPGALLSAFPVTRFSTLDHTAQRRTHDVLRQSVERLWSPFTVGRRGADLKVYRFHENLAELCAPGNTFTCQVNGAPGGKRVLEDFFATLLSGFDIVQVNVENARSNSLAEARDMRNHRGFYVLAHTRPFLGWTPTPTSLRLPASCAPVSANDAAMAAQAGSCGEAAYGGEGEAAAEHFCPTPVQMETATVELASADGSPSLTSSTTLVVPFTTYVEGVMGSGRLSHLVLRSPVMELLSSCEECPTPVRQCLQSKEALKMFATLRRAGVKPEIITSKTLLSASKQNEVWTAALGIL